MIADQLHGFRGFRITGQEGFHSGRIGFAGRRVRRPTLATDREIPGRF